MPQQFAVMTQVLIAAQTVARGWSLKKIECMLPADCLLTLTLNLAEPIFVAVDSLKMK